MLRNRLFRALWVANIASGIGSAVHDTAAVWTMATLTSSATLVALMQTMSSLPLFLLALPAGALADIVDRRKLILVAQIAALIASLFVVTLSWSGGLTPGMLLGITLLLGITTVFTLPTWQALLAEIVPRADLPGAITLGGIAINVARALGPLIAGVLLAASGPTAAFALNALSFAGIIFVLAAWRRPDSSPRKTGARNERMLGAMITALRFTRHSPVIQAVLARTAGFAFFAIAPIALLPLVVRSRQLAAADFGALMGAYGIGGILTAFLVLPALRRRFSADSILAGATLLFAASMFALSAATPLLLLGIALLLAGSAWLVAMATLGVAAQNAYPDWVRARSSAIYLLALQAAMGVGALFWGGLTGEFDAVLALRVAAGGLVATLAFAKRFSIAGSQGLDLSHSAHWKEHTFAVQPDQDDGPVLVTLDYDVRPEQVAAFREAIARLRIVRLRDGAFRWSLSHSLDAPGCYRESFHVGSWAEHLRQHERATVEDGRIEQAVQEFHSGEQPPRVSHYLLENVRARPAPLVARTAE